LIGAGTLYVLVYSIMIQTIAIKDLRVTDLPFLQDHHTLYTFDPRSILDECLGKHRYIVSCENILSTILVQQHIAVNQYALKHTGPDRNQLLIAEISGDPRISLYTRLRETVLPENIHHLYVAIPHPEADLFAAEKGLNINYSYPDFLKYNNKIAQKELLGDLTPAWSVIDPKAHSFDENADCYYKREVGAGGYATFHASDLSEMKLPSRKHPARWYREEAVEGIPRSVQIYRTIKGDYILFGYSEMKIILKKNYAGGLMRRTACIPTFVQEKITMALERLDALISGYSGFLGLDFLENGNKLQVLEANVRVTMATFATLQLNESDRQELEFYRFR
jgi:hypothetical protein